MNNLILVLNPGSTSTKIALYRETECVFTQSIEHPMEQLERYDRISDQYQMRMELVLEALNAYGGRDLGLRAVAARGGLLPPGPGGARLVNDAMVQRLKEAPMHEHASNLAAMIGFEIASQYKIPCYIYDPITTDELCPLARISGLPQIPRVSTVHALNSRMVARNAAKELGKTYKDAKIIVAHIGGGVSYSAHLHGKMVDLVLADEGSFSMVRSGGLPAFDLLKLCFSGNFSQKEVSRLLRDKGGVGAYLGTTDGREVERRIMAGDEQAKLVYEALAYQAAKSIAQLSVVFCGDVDAVVITGGLANSKLLTDWITQRIRFIAPVMTAPGEHEMEALAAGILRVLNHEEEAPAYSE